MMCILCKVYKLKQRQESGDGSSSAILSSLSYLCLYSLPHIIVPVPLLSLLSSLNAFALRSLIHTAICISILG